MEEYKVCHLWELQVKVLNHEKVVFFLFGHSTESIIRFSHPLLCTGRKEKKPGFQIMIAFK